ncbi:MAG: hypothetical protein U0797_00990 [Gemmataceae bacterium]
MSDRNPFSPQADARLQGQGGPASPSGLTEIAERLAAFKRAMDFGPACGTVDCAFTQALGLPVGGMVLTEAFAFLYLADHLPGEEPYEWAERVDDTLGERLAQTIAEYQRLEDEWATSHGY